MAETKTRASKGSPKSTTRTRGSSSKSRSPAKKSNSRAKSKSGPKSSSNSGRAQSALEAVEHTAKEAGSTVGRAASKAKLPLVASGAAVAGAVGGLAVGARQARRHRGWAMRRPQVKVRSRDLASAAKDVGSLGAQMGRLASELQQAREANGKHRSPVEVVLQGLTARRSRD